MHCSSSRLRLICGDSIAPDETTRLQTQATLVNDQAHTRKLEAKIGGQKGLTEITAQWKAMKVKVRCLQQRQAEEDFLLHLSSLSNAKRVWGRV